MLAVKPPLLPCEEGTFAKPRMSCLESVRVVRFCRSRATRVICHCAGHWPLSDAAALDLDPRSRGRHISANVCDVGRHVAEC